MKHALVFTRPMCVSATRTHGKQNDSSRFSRKARFLSVLALAACFALAPKAFAQIQSTTTCAAGHGYWDVLSVMMMDPSLAAGYHMEGITNGLPSAYVYTIWDPTQTKVWYVKNPQGNPWDINLYDSNYIYQWVTELGEWHGVNHWNDASSCKKFNSGSQSSTADLSMRWAARCAAPGGDNSTMWNPPPTTQPNNTNYYTYVDEVLQSSPQNLNYSRLKLLSTGTMNITDTRSNPPQTFSITTMPLQYTYSCSAENNIKSCQFREVFDYGLDTTVNPVDNVKHSYGWIRWRYYINSTGGNPKQDANWVLSNSSTSDELMAGQVGANFQCF
jgi:hypothetical protein